MQSQTRLNSILSKRHERDDQRFLLRYFPLRHTLQNHTILRYTMVNTRLRAQLNTKWMRFAISAGDLEEEKIGEGGNEGAGEKERGRGTKARAGTTKDKDQEERSVEREEANKEAIVGRARGGKN